MKFTTTNNRTYRRGIGNIPKPWIEYTGKNHIDSVYEYFDEKLKHWDFDIAGDETHDFVFEDGKAFRLEYSWWRDDWAGEDEDCLKDKVHVEEISIDDANVPEKKPGRDWI